MKRDAVGLQVSLDVEGRRALVVGADDEAADKVQRLLDGGAVVTVIAPTTATGELQSLGQRGRITLLQRAFFPADARDADVVLVCDRDPELAARVAEAAEADGAAVWCIDAPERSHFAMPALARAGKVRVAVSTSGASPSLASAMRQAIERALDDKFRRFVDQLADERARALAEEADPERRRERLRAAASAIEFELSLRWK